MNKMFCSQKMANSNVSIPMAYCVIKVMFRKMKNKGTAYYKI